MLKAVSKRQKPVESMLEAVKDPPNHALKHVGGGQGPSQPRFEACWRRSASAKNRFKACGGRVGAYRS